LVEERFQRLPMGRRRLLLSRLTAITPGEVVVGSTDFLSDSFGLAQAGDDGIASALPHRIAPQHQK